LGPLILLLRVGNSAFQQTIIELVVSHGGEHAEAREVSCAERCSGDGRGGSLGGWRDKWRCTRQNQASSREESELQPIVLFLQVIYSTSKIVKTVL
jgi:hypothetical protein